METGIGIIGCGYWGPHFIRLVKENNLSRLVKVCDSDKSRVKKCRKLFPGVEFTSSLEDIILNPAVEAVIISTPVKTHYELAKKSLSAGKHVLCEKPMTRTSREANELIALSRKNKKVLMPGHVFEFNSVVQYMRRLIASKKIGQVIYINMFRTGLGPVRNDVNVVYDLASHDISILNLLLGRLPITISAIGKSFVNSHHEDVAIVNFEFPGNVIASLTVSWMDPIKQRLIKVVGTKKMLLFDDVSNEKLKVVNTGKTYQSLKGDFGSFQLSTKDGDILIPNIKYPEPLKLEYEHFLDCIRKGSTPVSDAQSGLRVVRVLEAVCDSIKRNGKKISLK
ncbi:MAG TPA: Gfo/Idh/MocA family oxidoreductase [Chitinophagales bacterium]|nr:Gfo/Idh/MocA family oxidoreductase [Chitinophagales bacterium]